MTTETAFALSADEESRHAPWRGCGQIVGRSARRIHAAACRRAHGRGASLVHVVVQANPTLSASLRPERPALERERASECPTI